MKGKVKFFNRSRGWGFITCEDGEEAFLHISEIESGGPPDDEQPCVFERERGPRGLKAVAVKLLGLLFVFSLLCGLCGGCATRPDPARPGRSAVVTDCKVCRVINGKKVCYTRAQWSALERSKSTDSRSNR
ncbi:MAG: cold-shock protein [Phycisphaerae bacterium]